MSVFICYSRKDKQFVDQLTADLQAAGIQTWRDVDDIPGDVAANTASWRRAVDDALMECTHMIVVLSPDSVESVEVEAEWNDFLSRGNPLYPVMYKECRPPYRLRALQIWDLRQDYEGMLAQLVNLLPHEEPSSLPSIPAHTPATLPVDARMPSAAEPLPSTPPQPKADPGGKTPFFRRWWRVGVISVLWVSFIFSEYNGIFLLGMEATGLNVVNSVVLCIPFILLLGTIGIVHFIQKRILRGSLFLLTAFTQLLKSGVIIYDSYTYWQDEVYLDYFYYILLVFNLAFFTVASLWSLIDAIRNRAV